MANGFPLFSAVARTDIDMAGYALINASRIGNTDTVTLPIGQDYVDVLFELTQPDNQWELTQCVVENTVDSNPLNIFGTALTNKTRTGFRLQLNGKPDTSNYHLHWGFDGIGRGRSPTPLSSTATATDLINSIPISRTLISALDTGQGNFFDSQSYDPCVIVNPNDSSQLIMLFSAMAAPVETGAMTIGRATCSITNPNVWTLSPTSPVLTETFIIRADSIQYNATDGKLYLFYTGQGKTQLASSTDLGVTWTKLGVALAPGGTETVAFHLATFIEGSTIHGIYSYYTSTSQMPAFRYASASTSNWQSWTAPRTDCYQDTVGLTHEFHHLFKVGSTYLLIYEIGSATTDWTIRFATSSSPSSGWVRSPNTPFIAKSGISGTYDQYHVSCPHARIINGYWYVFDSGAKDHSQPYGTNHWPMGIVALGK